MESVIDNLRQVVKCTSGLVYCPSILIDAAIREIERLRAERDALRALLRDADEMISFQWPGFYSLKKRAKNNYIGPLATTLHVAQGVVDPETRRQIDIGGEVANLRRICDEFRREIERLRAERDALKTDIERLRAACKAAMSNLGVPQPGYPAPVAVAYEILDAALRGEGE